MQFNFDEWASLYTSNPVEFERKRAAVLEEAISNAPVECRNSLRVLQWECDIVRQGLSPLEATVALSNMMTESCNKLVNNLTELQVACNSFLDKPNNLK